jgi:hypothetical protein
LIIIAHNNIYFKTLTLKVLKSEIQWDIRNRLSLLAILLIRKACLLLIRKLSIGVLQIITIITINNDNTNLNINNWKVGRVDPCRVGIGPSWLGGRVRFRAELTRIRSINNGLTELMKFWVTLQLRIIWMFDGTRFAHYFFSLICVFTCHKWKFVMLQNVKIEP